MQKLPPLRGCLKPDSEHTFHRNLCRRDPNKGEPFHFEKKSKLKTNQDWEEEFPALDRSFWLTSMTPKLSFHLMRLKLDSESRKDLQSRKTLEQNDL